MVLNFQNNLNLSLQRINCHQHFEYPLHIEEIERTYQTSDDLLETYTDVKWKIVNTLNEIYSSQLLVPVVLENWFNNVNKEDEVSYFLNEVGSNILSYSQFKVPSKFHLWLGRKGFIIGIEQKGASFDAEKINSHKLKNNEGAAFEFFRKCNSTIFFDHPKEARIVMMEVLFVHSRGS
ncbi:hypothetical protein HYU21_00340 [Candidatus Woesearchaeota archaeon]|nr:hypothetical protein [Candidatus Woesearchaeota archaeon]